MNGHTFGTVRWFAEIPTDEAVKTVKEELVEEMCNEIRRLAAKYPDEFFIVTESLSRPYMTIGAKITLPTLTRRSVYNDKEQSDSND